LDQIAESFPDGKVIRQPKPIEVQLDPGDILLLWSDGVPDSLPGVLPRDIARRFTELLTQIAAEKPESPQQVIDRLRGELRRDEHGLLADDATMIALRWRGPEPATDAVK
jgi:serine phosphatase RsbU (regulator of sigma subunit)